METFQATGLAGKATLYDDSKLATDLDPFTVIRIWHKQYVEGIEVWYAHRSNGKLLGTAVDAKSNMTELMFMPDEYIAEISGRSGHWLDSVTFTTTQGRVITCGTGTGGNPFRLAVPNMVVYSLKYEVGEFLNYLGAVFGPQKFPTGAAHGFVTLPGQVNPPGGFQRPMPMPMPMPMPGGMPGQMPGGMPGQMPGGMPGPMPGSGTMPGSGGYGQAQPVPMPIPSRPYKPVPSQKQPSMPGPGTSAPYYAAPGRPYNPNLTNVGGYGPAPGGQMPGRPMPGGPMRGRPMPGGTMPGGPMPGGTMPGGPMPGGQVPGGQIPGGPMSGGDVPGFFQKMWVKTEMAGKARESDKFFDDYTEVLTPYIDQGFDPELEEVVLISSGSLVVGIECTYRMTHKNGPIEYKKVSHVGKEKGMFSNKSEVKVSLANPIVAVRGRSGDLIDRVDVVTASGAAAAIGGNGGSEFAFAIPPGRRVLAFGGGVDGFLSHIYAYHV